MDIQDRQKIFQLGKGFEMGLVSYECLTDSQKYDLNRYFALKNDILDTQIEKTTYSLNSINNKLDEVYNNLMGNK